jgi:hypothetical protein
MSPRGWQGRGKGPTGFYETLRKDLKLREIFGGWPIQKKLKTVSFPRDCT